LHRDAFYRDAFYLGAIKPSSRMFYRDAFILASGPALSPIDLM
jgi:hypothetical protein